MNNIVNTHSTHSMLVSGAPCFIDTAIRNMFFFWRRNDVIFRHVTPVPIQEKRMPVCRALGNTLKSLAGWEEMAQGT